MERDYKECAEMMDSGQKKDCVECSMNGGSCFGCLGEYPWRMDDGWISVDDRLPDESLNSVIGWNEYRERSCFVQYYGGRWMLRADREPIKITHWRPLPDRPERSGIE